MYKLKSVYFKIIVIWVVLLLPTTSFSQDIIWKEDGEVLDVFIHKMRFARVVYRLEDDKKAPKFRLRYQDISKVERVDGTIHYYMEGREISKEPTELFMLGWTDADFHYKVHPLAQTVSLLSMGVFSYASLAYSSLFVIGYNTPFSIGSSLPKDHNLRYPDINLFTDEAYAAGYRDRASRIKERRVNTMGGVGFGIGAIVFLALTL